MCMKAHCRRLPFPHSYCRPKADHSDPTGLKHFYFSLCAFWILQLKEKLNKAGKWNYQPKNKTDHDCDISTLKTEK